MAALASYQSSPSTPIKNIIKSDSMLLETSVGTVKELSQATAFVKGTTLITLFIQAQQCLQLRGNNSNDNVALREMLAFNKQSSHFHFSNRLRASSPNYRNRKISKTKMFVLRSKYFASVFFKRKSRLLLLIIIVSTFREHCARRFILFMGVV